MLANIVLLLLLLLIPVIQVRKQIVPVNRKWPLETLIGALKDLFPRNLAKSHPRHVLIEYVMLRDVNDSLEDAHRCWELEPLSSYALPCHIVIKHAKILQGD